jgi:uncharacterized RmlC-like cupin family protein
MASATPILLIVPSSVGPPGRLYARSIDEIVRIRPDRPTETLQRLPYFIGVCETTAPTTGLSLSLVVVPPGTASEPHYHDGFETAIYQLEGRVETRYGERFEQSVVTEAGDFLFIAPGVPHQVRNLSETERAAAVVARNDAGELERVVLVEPAP